jgi:Tyrosine phosphatase family
MRVPLSRRPRLVVRSLLVLCLAISAPAALYIAYDQATSNFGVVQPGRVYRSGQMPPKALARALRQYSIKTVLNLRGSNSNEAWYRDEVKTTLAAGATQIDVPMSSCLWLSRDRLSNLIELLEQADYPLLIHCNWGSERTGLVSAFAELLRPGATLAEARAEFSLGYLFVRLGDGTIMAQHLDQYESWLRARGLAHDRETFKKWVAEGFRPLLPNREQWPYDPYPLSVITRPGAQPEIRPLAGRPNKIHR